MYPLAYQDPENYILILNSLIYIINTVFGLFVILGSIFISGNILVIFIESIWGIFLIIWSIRYLIKNKSFSLIKQIFLSF